MSEARSMVVGLMFIASIGMVIVAAAMLLSANTPERRAQGSMLGIMGGLLLLACAQVAR